MVKAARLASCSRRQAEEPAADVGAALAIAQTGTGSGEQAVALAVFVLSGRSARRSRWRSPSSCRSAAPGRSSRLRDWMLQENATIIAVLCLVLAAKLVGDAVVALTS